MVMLESVLAYDLQTLSNISMRSCCLLSEGNDGSSNPFVCSSSGWPLPPVSQSRRAVFMCHRHCSIILKPALLVLL